LPFAVCVIVRSETHAARGDGGGALGSQAFGASIEEAIVPPRAILGR
jgi:hypothetical protein